jgi:hypothetical protein
MSIMGEFMSEFNGFRPFEFIKIWKNFDRIDPMVWLVIVMGLFLIFGLSVKSMNFVALIGGFILFVFIAIIGVGMIIGISRK